MKICRGVVAVLLLVVVLATGAVAQEGGKKVQRSHNPRLIGTAVLVNLVYVPTRLMLVAVGGFLGGFAGFITLGDGAAARSIWGLTDGSAVITPEMLEGTEEFHFSAYD
jgi:hypothetical protein